MSGTCGTEQNKTKQKTREPCHFLMAERVVRFGRLSLTAVSFCSTSSLDSRELSSTTSASVLAARDRMTRFSFVLFELVGSLLSSDSAGLGASRPLPRFPSGGSEDAGGILDRAVLLSGRIGSASSTSSTDGIRPRDFVVPVLPSDGTLGFLDDGWAGVACTFLAVFLFDLSLTSWSGEPGGVGPRTSLSLS